jgi:multidrug efflux system outer membrane protein
MRSPIRTLVSAALVVALQACAVGPSYKEPAAAVPAEFAARGEALRVTAVAPTAWWESFDDPVLSALIVQADVANRDLVASAARLDAAGARAAAASRQRWPIGEASGGRAAGEQSEGEGDRRIDHYRFGVSAGWEIDFFGRLASIMRAADARREAAAAELADLRLVVAGEVVRTYFALRGAERRAELFAAFAADQQRVVELTAARVDEGSVAQDDLARARAQLAADRSARVLELDRAVRLENALAVLVGQPAGAWHVAPAPLAELRVKPIAIGDPAALIRRRPDVRAAERALAAATADAAAATAELWPQIRIDGSLAHVAGAVGELDTGGSRSWLLAPSISWPLFDRARVRAGIRASEAEARAALAELEEAVLRAVAEAESAFAGYGFAQERLAELADQAVHARRAAELARVRYDEGATDYLLALDAARTARLAEAALVDGLVAQRFATVQVHVTLGAMPGDGGA